MEFSSWLIPSAWCFDSTSVWFVKMYPPDTNQRVNSFILFSISNVTRSLRIMMILCIIYLQEGMNIIFDKKTSSSFLPHPSTFSPLFFMVHQEICRETDRSSEKKDLAWWQQMTLIMSYFYSLWHFMDHFGFFWFWTYGKTLLGKWSFNIAAPCIGVSKISTNQKNTF